MVAVSDTGDVVSSNSNGIRRDSLHSVCDRDTEVDSGTVDILIIIWNNHFIYQMTDQSSIGFNPYLTGISILLVQLGGRFLTSDFTPSQIAIFSNMYVKLIIIFLILLTSVQNIWYAFILTGVYYVCMYILFHP